jgi:hypothetical protein
MLGKIRRYQPDMKTNMEVTHLHKWLRIIASIPLVILIGSMIKIGFDMFQLALASVPGFFAYYEMEGISVPAVVWLVEHEIVGLIAWPIVLILLSVFGLWLLLGRK